MGNSLPTETQEGGRWLNICRARTWKWIHLDELYPERVTERHPDGRTAGHVRVKVTGTLLVERRSSEAVRFLRLHLKRWEKYVRGWLEEAAND